MKNKEIFELYTALSTILGEPSKELGIRTKFKLAKNQIAIDKIYELVQKQHNSIIERYGEEKENGVITVPPEKIDITRKEINELMEINNEITLEKINLDELDGAPITSETLMKLMPIIEETHDE